MTFSEIGEILGLGRRDEKTKIRQQAMTKFGKILEKKKDCYEMTESRTEGGAKLAKLTRDYYHHCQAEFFGV